MKNLFIGFLIFLIHQTAFAGTYNFYFNNTEQGNNSTASPNVIIKDDKGNALPPPSTDAEQTQAPSETNQAESIANTNSSSANVVEDTPNTEFPTPQWRIAFGPIKNSRGGLISDVTYRDNISGNQIAYSQGSLFYFPTKKIGLGFQVGRFLGPEGAYNPFGIKQGFGKVNFEITASLLSDLNDRFEKNLFFGGQVSLNVIKDLGVGFALRFTPYERDGVVRATANWNLHLLF